MNKIFIYFIVCINLFSFKIQDVKPNAKIKIVWLRNSKKISEITNLASWNKIQLN